MQTTAHISRQAPGFTVIEFVVVIILVGIVGVVVASRFVAPNSFNDVAAQDGLLATIRAAQQASLGRPNVSFEIDSDANEWEFIAKSGTTVLRSFEVDKSDLILETGSAAASGDTCATPSGDFDVAVANDFALSFDQRGDLDSFTNASSTESVNSAFNGVRICVNSTDALSVCVSPAGYAYEGNCDD